MSVQNAFLNPTNEQRHELLKEALNNAGRTEDYENIIELLGPGPDISELASENSLKNHKIGIIGAGLAGLSAAYELRKLGASITVYDAEDKRIGGRVYTHYFNKSTEYFSELGATRIPISHDTSWHYINLFNLNTSPMTSPNSNSLLYTNNIRMRRSLNGREIEEFLYPLYDLTEKEKNTPWSELISYADNTMLNSLTPVQRSEILKILPQYSPQYAELTKMSTRDVYDSLGLSQGFVNLLCAVNPIAAVLLNLSYNETMTGIYSFDFLSIYRVTGGMIKLPLAFISSLINNNPPELPNQALGKVNIKLGHTVDGIFLSSNNYIDLQYTDPKGDKSSESFDLVICTIPFSVLREFNINPYFNDTKMQAIRELNYLDAQKTGMFFNERFWEENEPYGNINGGISYTDLIIQSIIYPLDNYSYTEPGTLIASYNIGADATRLCNQNNYRRFEKIKQNLEQVHGLPKGYLDSLIKDYKTVHWNSEQWSRSAFSAGYPGQKTNLAYSMIQPEYNNRLYFAGEHISTKPRWIQGSLQTGKWVANQIAMNI